jgi:transcriptional regulator of NAD metabolism
MAKIQSETVTIKLSKLVKDSDGSHEHLASEDFEANLEAIVQELVGAGVIVEIERT